MAEKYWGGQNPVGQRINFFADHPTEKDWTTVVGVVGDVKDKPNSLDAEPAFWWPSLQQAFPFPAMSVVIRGSIDPQTLANELRDEVNRLDPTLAVANIREMSQIVQGSVSTPHFAFVLVGLFAALAVLLAGIGIYGVVAYSVGQRTSEFGLRMALGAQHADIFALVLMQAAALVFSGTIIGLGLALAMGRALNSLIYDVSPADPLTLTAAGLFVIAAAILPCLVPARKATATDPMIALRAE